VVRDRVASFHSTSPENWERIIGVIQDALSLSDKNPDGFVFVDGVMGKKNVL
jgi:hypothetical protein